jgi:hypothetical protein
MVWDHEVAGSNPATPTAERRKRCDIQALVFRRLV